MSRQTFIFVGTQARTLTWCTSSNRRSAGPSGPKKERPLHPVGTMAVYVGEHEFDDDDIACRRFDVPLRSLYPAMIEFRDTAATSSASSVAGSLRRSRPRAATAVYIDDMQKVLDGYQPPGNGPFLAK